MKGYLLRQQQFVVGEETFIESNSNENSFAVIFEDDLETGYFYALEIDPATKEQRILDMMHIYNVEDVEEKDRPGEINIIWTKDWLKCALIINKYCHAVFDFQNHGGHNRNEFPPPNNIWTKGTRKLTDEMITAFFK